MTWGGFLVWSFIIEFSGPLRASCSQERDPFILVLIFLFWDPFLLHELILSCQDKNIIRKISCMHGVGCMLPYQALWNNSVLVSPFTEVVLWSN